VFIPWNQLTLPKSGAPMPPPKPSAQRSSLSAEAAGGAARPGLWDTVKSAVAAVQRSLLKTEAATEKHVAVAADRQRAGSAFLNGKATPFGHGFFRPIKVPEPVSRLPMPPVKHVAPGN
jgi:hypothetical protein